MVVAMTNERLRFGVEPELEMSYQGVKVGQHKPDFIVENAVVVELKAVESLHPVYLAQVITYLKLTGCPAGLIMNFNTASLRSGLRRLDHPDLYRKRPPMGF